MTPELILAIAQLIATIGPLGMDLYLKLESLMNLTPDEKQNVANAIAAANSANDATIDRVAQWMEQNGFVKQVSFVPKPSAPPAQ